MRSATFPSAIIEERADDRGDVYVYVNGMPSYETFDHACTRARASSQALQPIPGPTIADLERLTKPHSIRQWISKLVADFREGARYEEHVRYFREQKHHDPHGAARALLFLDRHYLADFRDFASKRRLAGIDLHASKQVYVMTHLHAQNCAELSGEERAWLKHAIQGMEAEDAFTPAALAVEREEMAEQMRQIKEWRRTRPLTVAERAQFSVLTARGR